MVKIDMAIHILGVNSFAFHIEGLYERLVKRRERWRWLMEEIWRYH